MKVILTIDPGLRNLSFCILNSKFEILLWDTINILDGDDYHCKSFFKNGKLCNRKCNMKYRCENNWVYTCKTHFPKEIKKTAVNDFKKKNIDKYDNQDIVVTLLNKIQEIYDNNEPVFKTLTQIHIELQPKCNPKLLRISHIIYGKLIDLYKDTIPINFVKASKKLLAYTGPEIECKLKGAYAKRKFLSICYIKWFLENKFLEEQKEKWLPIFLSHSKKDDMSDTLLMAINVISGIPSSKKSKRK